MKAKDFKEEKTQALDRIKDLSVDTLQEIVRLYVKPTGKEETIDEYNKALDEAEARVKNGQFVTHEDFKKEMAKWK